MSSDKDFEQNVIHLIETIYRPLKYTCSDLIKENESSEYGGYTFKLNRQTVIFRTAKITPTKTGQFVTVWKRNKKGITEPFHADDGIGFYIICCQNKEHFGHFVFSKLTLEKYGIISTDKKEGKRGMRVYPPWDLVNSKQAQKTQQWQLTYFIDMSDLNSLNKEQIHTLYSSLS